MDAVRFGPLVFAIDRFAVLLGVAAFLLAVWWLARRRAPPAAAALDRWGWRVLLAALVAGRAGHVAAHWESFAAEPWRALAVWDGALATGAAVTGAVLVTLFEIGRHRGLGGPAAASLALGLAVWGGALILAGPRDPPAPPAQLFATADGRPVSLAARDGRPAAVMLWATWCPQCRRMLPMMAEAAARHPGVDVIFANQREAPGRVGLFLATEGLRLDLLLLDEAGVLGRHYGAFGLPTTVLLDGEGRVRETHVGAISRETFEAALVRIQAAPEKAAAAR